MNTVAWQEIGDKGALDRSLILARAAVDLAPQVAAYRDTLGWIYRARGQLPQAAAELEKAATSDDPEIVTHLGIVYQDLGQKAQAAATFQRALAHKPNYAPAREALEKLK